MDWYRLDVGNYPADKVQDLFEGVFVLARAPKNAALFIKAAPSDHDAEYYLSPDAARLCGPLLKAFNGRPSHRPPLAGTTLLVGHADALNLLK
jgi:hypothetical protein